MTRLTIDVSGMSCQHCVRAVRTALEGVSGVHVERVDIGKAEVQYDQDKTTVTEITDAIADAGYPAAATTN